MQTRTLEEVLSNGFSLDVLRVNLPILTDFCWLKAFSIFRKFPIEKKNAALDIIIKFKPKEYKEPILVLILLEFLVATEDINISMLEEIMPYTPLSGPEFVVILNSIETQEGKLKCIKLFSANKNNSVNMATWGIIFSSLEGREVKEKATSLILDSMQKHYIGDCSNETQFSSYNSACIEGESLSDEDLENDEELDSMLGENHGGYDETDSERELVDNMSKWYTVMHYITSFFSWSY